MKWTTSLLCGAALVISGCASAPMGPTLRAMPPEGKAFEQYQSEKTFCKQYADSEVLGQDDAATTKSIIQGTAGTVLGAGLGVALGGGEGAAIGAAGGALAGTMVGAGSSAQAEDSIQDQYDNSFAECMTAKGNLVERPIIYRPGTTILYTNAPQPIIIHNPPPPGYPPY